MVGSFYYKSKDGKSYLCLSSPDYDNHKDSRSNEFMVSIF